MASNEYGYRTRLSGVSMEEAEKRVTAALSGQGFGVLSEIDVAATLKKKLGIDKAPYKILGACNPELANRALSVEPEIGLLLPCNVIVYQDGEDVVVSALEPSAMFAAANLPSEMQAVAAEAQERLHAAIDGLH